MSRTGNQEVKEEEGGAVSAVNYRTYGKSQHLRMARAKITTLGPGVSSLVAAEPSSSGTPSPLLQKSDRQQGRNLKSRTLLCRLYQKQLDEKILPTLR